VSRPHPAEVDWVRPNSPAARAGIRAGERIVRVNGRAPKDYIDYRYLTAEPQVALVVESAAGERRRLAVAKPLDEELGLRFTEDVFDGIRTCRNRCPFCFVDQLPGGLRMALSIHDDDYRLSFLHGNFVTLTNLTPADRARIIRLRLSPLYVSVHATEPEVRRTIFGRATGDVCAGMARLIARGIEFHAQIVLCPGINDGPHLERTVRDLAALHPGLRSIGVVPVGLTRHRRGLAPLRPVTPAMAGDLVREIRRWQRELLRELGSRLVFAADELYLLSGLPFPGRGSYEGFPQLGNGIGCARLFLEGVRRMRPPRLRQFTRVTLATGEMAAGLVKEMARKLAAGGRVSAQVCVIENRLLGRSVTTAGLLAGRDIARALAGRDLGDLVIVPAGAVREGEGFLDGMTVEALSRRVGAPVVAAAGPREVTAALRRLDRERDAR
jgi:putative radical SAM enzyme (TIGR03279 family)